MIWLVTQGDYSDYRIVHAFSNEDAATKHAEQWNATGPSDEYRVEAHELLTEPPELSMIYYASWENHGHDKVWSASWFREAAELEGRLDRLEARQYNDDAVRRGLVGFLCYSLDPEKAMKIVSDARAKHLAQEAGL